MHVARAPSATTRNAWAQWGPLALLCGAALFAAPHVPGWVLMWLLTAAVVAGFKWAIAYAYGPVSAAWAFGWLGMDPAGFHRPALHPPKPREIWPPLLEVAAGAALLWGVVPRIEPVIEHDLVRAWTGVLGAGLLLHFGVVSLLGLLWRRRGYDARPIFRAPLASRSLGEFWGRRWNRSFSDVVRPWVYRRLLPRVGARAALGAVFLVSGLGHDLLLSVPARGGYGLCTLYFLIQGAGVVVERRRRSRLLTLAVVLVPLPLLFHPPFLRNVVLPFLRAIGASP